MITQHRSEYPGIRSEACKKVTIGDSDWLGSNMLSRPCTIRVLTTRQMTLLEKIG